MHPYTQILVSSIPIPDPTKRWKDALKVEFSTLKEFRVEQGCKLSHRCPHAMEICKEENPPSAEVKPGRKIACFLYPEVVEATKSK